MNTRLALAARLTLTLAALLAVSIGTLILAKSSHPIVEMCVAVFEDSFMPHGHCYLWKPSLLWIHAGSDSVIALSYLTIPFTLLYFLKRKPEIRFGSMLILFGAFICLCGLTHLIAVFNIWNGAYWLSGFMKFATAIASMSTAVMLAKAMPLALSIPLPNEYRKVSAQLAKESADREIAERRLHARVGSDTQKLWESENRWKLLTEFVYSAVWVTNPNGMVEHELPSWGKLTGQSFEEYKGSGWLNAYLDTDRKALSEVWQQSLDSQSNYEFEAHLWNAEQKRYVPVLIKGIPIKNESGEILEWMGAVHDLSEIKQHEITLASYARRLQAKNAYLQEFTQVASHDLREPLRKIQAYGDILTEDFREILPEEAQSHIDVMQKASKRMSALIDDLLDYSRASRADIELADVDLNVLLESIESDLEVSIEESGAHIHYNELGSVKADETQIHRVFQNLISNAIKYRKPEESPDITISHAIIDRKDMPEDCIDRSSERYHKISVTDNGIGFEQEHAKRIFKPFERLHRRESYQGTGIGLAICQRIVERHNGHLQASSELGKGSTFSVYLPVHE